YVPGPQNYTTVGFVAAGINGATNYTWTFAGPAGKNLTITPVPTPPNATCVIQATACGIYSIYCTAFNNTVNPGTPVPIQTNLREFTITCPTAASITAVGLSTNNAICVGSSATLTGVGAATYS